LYHTELENHGFCWIAVQQNNSMQLPSPFFNRKTLGHIQVKHYSNGEVFSCPTDLVSWDQPSCSQREMPLQNPGSSNLFRLGEQRIAHNKSLHSLNMYILIFDVI